MYRIVSFKPQAILAYPLPIWCARIVHNKKFEEMSACTDCVTEASHSVECVKALNNVHQEIRQTIDAVLSARDISERFQAAKHLTTLQMQFNQLSQLVQKHAERARQCSLANTRCLAHDRGATEKVIHCLKLEQQAGLLDQYMQRRDYGRLHPRYLLDK